jgi:hypothetical protein
LRTHSATAARCPARDDEAGATVDPVDRWGFTPLDDAIRHRHTALADDLRARGATSGPGARARVAHVSTEVRSSGKNVTCEQL